MSTRDLPPEGGPNLFQPPRLSRSFDCASPELFRPCPTELSISRGPFRSFVPGRPPRGSIAGRVVARSPLPAPFLTEPLRSLRPERFPKLCQSPRSRCRPSLSSLPEVTEPPLSRLPDLFTIPGCVWKPPRSSAPRSGAVRSPKRPSPAPGICALGACSCTTRCTRSR